LNGEKLGVSQLSPFPHPASVDHEEGKRASQQVPIQAEAQVAY